MMIRYLKHIISSKYNQIRWEINFALRLKTTATLTKTFLLSTSTPQKHAPKPLLPHLNNK